MAIITRNPTLARFEWAGSFSERTLPKSNKWRWSPEDKIWWTDDARKVQPLVEYSSTEVIPFLEELDSKIQASYATELTDGSVMADQIKAFGAHRGMQLFPFQQAGVSYILKAKRCLIGDDMGLGKTMQAIAAASISDCPHIYICCPKAVATNWAAKISDWTGGRAEILKGIKPGKPTSQSKWVIVPYSIVANRWQELDNSGAFVICDEVHYLKNPKAKRTAAILGSWNATVRQSIKGLATKACYFVGLTGTPMPNRPRELHPVLTGGCRQRWAFGMQYLDRYCGPAEVWNGRRYITTYDGATNTEELAKLLRENCMIRRTKKQVLKDLPAKIRDKVPLDPEKYKGPALSREQIEHIESAIALGELPEFEFISEIRHEQAMAKVPLVLDYIKQTRIDERDGPAPAVIFAHHRDVAEQIQYGLQGLGCDCDLIYGGTPTEGRDLAVERFRTGETPFIVGTIGAMGTGVDGLQKRCSTVIFAEMDWVPGNMDQAEDRLCRIGQTDSVSVYYMILEGTIDTYLFRTGTDKRGIIGRVMADDGEEIPDDKQYGSKAKAPKPKSADAKFCPEPHNTTILNALRSLAQVCDGAASRDDSGFNGIDSAFGKNLAEREKLTRRQATAALKMLKKYHNTQLPGHPVTQIDEGDVA